VGETQNRLSLFNEREYAHTRMTKFLLFGLLGFAAIAAWVWLRRQPRDNKVSAVPPPPAAPDLKVEEEVVEPPAEADVPELPPKGWTVGGEPEKVGEQLIPNAVPEVTNDSASLPSPDSEPALPNSGDSVSEQVAKTSPVTSPADKPQDTEVSVGSAERPTSPEVVVSPEPSTKAAETATPHEEDVFKNAGPTIAQPNADSISGLSTGKADAATISPPESTILPTVKEEEPSIETLQHQAPEEADIAPRPPTYHPPAPPAPTAPTRSPRTPPTQNTPVKQNGNANLRLRVQLVFGRGGVVKSLALAPDRRDGMPSEIEITGTQGELHLAELRDDCYEPVMLADASNALLQGVEWRGRGDARRWRWILGSRELYVLAPGDEFGLRGFVSTARLWLNARHVVLATKRLREEVLSALAEAGCATPEIGDDTIPGVPSGWLLFRDVIPTRAVPMRDDRDILNSLCPAHEIEPHFVGGIRLERNTWLAGFPPRIRFTGEFANGFQVKIDDHPAHPASDGAFEVAGWDSEGEHRLWFGDRAETYSLCTMDEGWSHWHAHDFGTGAAICGASTDRIDGARWRQVCIPAANPLLIGARPGEIFRCRVRNGVNTERILALVPFAPVWALPMDRLSEKNCSARLVLLEFIEPINTLEQSLRKRNNNSALRQWAFSIRNVRRKQLTLAVESDDTKSLWRRYGVVAKHLWRQLR
jgi:hypothetical protein